MVLLTEGIGQPPSLGIFPDQGWNPGLAVKTPSPNPWTAEQFPGVTFLTDDLEPSSNS